MEKNQSNQLEKEADINPTSKVDCLGISLGSESAVVSYFDVNGDIKVKSMESGDKYIPTVICYPEDSEDERADERCMGAPALDQKKGKVDKTLQTFGRFLGLVPGFDAHDKQIKIEKEYIQF